MFCKCKSPSWVVTQNTMGGNPHPTNPITRRCSICGNSEETELDR